MNYLSKAFIILFSEVIWVYYLIAMFASVEWGEGVFVNAIWWIVAGIIGFIFNLALAGRTHYLVIVIGNGLLFVFIIIQNWKTTVPEGLWLFGIILSVAVGFVFVRGASLVYKEPTRLQMLRRFEGNIILYAILAFVFTFNDWGNDYFHLAFLFAVFISLMGMVLTLQSHAQDDENLRVEVRRIGKPGWFTAAIGLMLVGMSLVSAILFLPTIRQTLHTLGMNALSGVTWIYNMVIGFITWLFSLFPAPETDGELPEATQTDPIIKEEMGEETVFTLPYEWIIGVLGVLAIVIFIWVVSKFLKQWQPSKKAKAQRVFMFKESWWENLFSELKLYLKRLKMKWRVRFARFYEKEVYWYYYQVQKWGKKNGFHQLASETTKEYVEKIISDLDLWENTNLSKDESEQLTLGLRKINLDYQAVYYGQRGEKSNADYKHLLDQLKGLRLNR